MKTCPKCHADNADSSAYCEVCGSLLQEVKRENKPVLGRANENKSGYMSGTELWSWLQKSSKRQHFYTAEVNTLTQAEYIDKLAGKLQENHVPAHVMTRGVQWDRSNVRQDVCVVEPESNAVNPISCLVQFNHVGKFTFVEEKTYITPPNLPAVPGKKRQIPPDLAKRGSWLVLGVLIVIVGLLMAIAIEPNVLSLGLMVAGGGLTYLGYSGAQKLKELMEYNKRCEEEERAWAAAWDNWENSIFLHSFQENVNGQISRIYDAVFECIKQLNEELFNEQQSVEQQESQSMNELEQLIARRKEDYR